MKHRDQLRMNAALTQDPANWQIYRETRNKCTKLLKEDKIRYHRTLFTEAEANNDTKTIYKKTKNLLGWNNCAAPDRFEANGRMEHRPQVMADIQMEHFSKKITDLRKTLPAMRKDPMSTLKNAFRRWKYSQNLPELSFKGVTETEILKMLKKMNNSTSLATDELDAQSVKMAAKYLYKPLTFIVNLSLDTGIFATKWKTAKLVPIFKGKGNNRYDPNSFRPVSLLPVVAKLTEKVVKEKLMKHMEHNRLFNENHHAYRGQLSTTTAILQLADTVWEGADKNWVNVTMALDETSAFDCVSYNLLLEKLKLYKLDELSLKWMNSYLRGRSQFTTIGGKNSRIITVDRGVPQGSILGPILYTIFINEMPDVINQYQDCTDNVHLPGDWLFSKNCTTCGSLPSYADDATFVHTSKSRMENQAIVANRLEIPN